MLMDPRPTHFYHTSRTPAMSLFANAISSASRRFATVSNFSGSLPGYQVYHGQFPWLPIIFVAFCLHVRTLNFCQQMGFPLNY